MQAPVFIVIGPPGHGKSAARKILAELTFLRGDSCSTIIYAFLAHRRKVTKESLYEIPKEQLRPDLIEAGNFLVGAIDTIAAPPEDPEIDRIVYRIPSALIRTLYMSGVNIIDGVRRKSELVHAIDHLTWNGVRSVVIWIERPGADLIKDNTDLTSADATDIVMNDGTLDELKAQLKLVVEKHFGKQDGKPKPIPVFDSPEEAFAEAETVAAKPVSEL